MLNEQYSIKEYLDLKDLVFLDPQYEREFLSYEHPRKNHSPETFAREAIWVILNSGMKNQVAQKIYERVIDAIDAGTDISDAFGHKGKVSAIKHIWENKKDLYGAYKASKDKLEFLVRIPWIGGITKYHLAKNLGHDCAKPDRHLVRIANEHGESVDDLCLRLSEATGDRIASVDYVLWRAANQGLI